MTEQGALTLQWGSGEGHDLGANDLIAEPVSLVMAIDVSTSISDPDYIIQREGTALALRNIADEIVKMAESGTPVVLTYLEFNDEATIRIEPTIHRDAEDVELLAQKVESMQRIDTEGTTLTSKALAAATDIHTLVENRYGTLSRKVTDVSADGFGTQGSRRDIDPAGPDDAAEFANVLEQRDRATAQGIEINGIIMPHHIADIRVALRDKDPQILGMLREGGGISQDEIDTLVRERPELFTGDGSSIALNERFYKENVVNGFTMRAPTAEAYGETLELKLIRELLISNNDTTTTEPQSGYMASIVQPI